MSKSTTYNNSTLSRGSLSSLKGGQSAGPISEDDKQWFKQVCAAAMTVGDSAYMNYDEVYMGEDLNEILNLWENYRNDNFIEFNSDYFSPFNR